MNSPTRILLSLLAAAGSVFNPPAAIAQVPGLLQFQSRILVGTTPFAGTGEFKFAIVNGNGTVTYWSNDGTSTAGGEPANSVSLAVSQGHYSVLLGDTALAQMTTIPASVFAHADVRLRVWFDDGVHGSQQLSPDQRIAAVGYALVAGTVSDGAVTTEKIATAAVTSDKIGGVLSAAQIPLMDANKIASGIMDPARLPANITYSEELLSISDLLTARLVLVEEQLNGIAAHPLIAASSSADDPALDAAGYIRFGSLPAPAWAAGTLEGQPSARFDHSGLWTGSAFMVWGGRLSGGVYSGTGASYDLIEDVWQVVSPVNAPSARGGHTACWTGDEMIVWGGFSSGGYVQSGARFRVSTQNWLPLPLASAPDPREGHLAVWTGARMIIWGGRNDGGLLADGFSYSPVSDSWSPLNLAEGPSGRIGAASVWAGDRWILWGGEDESGSVHTGAQLLFDAEGVPLEWRSMSVDGAPLGRSGHTVVWTGNRVLVWGGLNNGIFLADGAAYDPATDQWDPIPHEGAPAARSGHSAIWTGSEMVVLAGDTAAGPVAGGAAYDPGANQWRPLSNPGSPQPRSGGTAVWTGTELIVFGGLAASQPVASLNRVNPQPAWHLYRKLQGE